jgi:hypothetical protein
MLNFDYIDRFPVIIISSPRTGSNTLLTNILDYFRQKDQNFFALNEPHHSNHGQDFQKFLRICNQPQPYVIKFHAYNYRFYKELDPKIKANDCYLIRLKRQNVIEQIASSYIAAVRNKGYYTINDEIVDETIVIDRKKIKLAINAILKHNQARDNFDAKFDKEMILEDIEFNDSFMIKTPKPSNYQELIEQINWNISQGQYQL